MVLQNGFSDERFTDAVNHVIANCIYPTPTIAQFISYDRTERLYTHSEMVEMVNAGNKNAFKQLTKIEIDGKIYWK